MPNSDLVNNVGPDGRELLEHYEGLRLTAYQDSVGVWTIGYGDTENVHEGMTITQAEADERLNGRLSRDFVPGVLAVLKRESSQSQFDAMVCFAYNVGIGALTSSTLLRLFNSGDIAGAADQFPRWDKAGGQSLKGLRKRRAAERALFLGADVENAIAVGDETA